MIGEGAYTRSVLLEGVCRGWCERRPGERRGLGMLPCRLLVESVGFRVVWWCERSRWFLCHLAARASLSGHEDGVVCQFALQDFGEQARLDLEEAPVADPVAEERVLG